MLLSKCFPFQDPSFRQTIHHPRLPLQPDEYGMHHKLPALNRRPSQYMGWSMSLYIMRYPVIKPSTPQIIPFLLTDSEVSQDTERETNDMGTRGKRDGLGRSSA